MTSRDFCYWLQGYLEITGVGDPSKVQDLTVSQIQCLKKHLHMVFKTEIDPSINASITNELNQIHNQNQVGLQTSSPGLNRELIRC